MQTTAADGPSGQAPDAPRQAATRDHRRAGRKRTMALAVLVACAFALTALAGCTSNMNRSPEAVLKVDRETAWSGQSIAFDGRQSSDPEGRLVTWHFDFGDQMTADAHDNGTARQVHTYAHGGAFLSTLTVTDNGTADAAARTDMDSQRIVVNQRDTVAASALYSSPANLTASSSSAMPFAVYQHADRGEAVLNVTSLTALGSSQLTVTILDPTDQVITEQVVDVPAGQTVQATVGANLDATGEYTLALKATSGGMGVTGQMDRYYS